MSDEAQKESLIRLATRVAQYGYDRENYLEWVRHEVYGKLLGYYECPDLQGLAPMMTDQELSRVLPVLAVDASMPIETIYQALTRQLRRAGQANNGWSRPKSVLDTFCPRSQRSPQSNPYFLQMGGQDLPVQGAPSSMHEYRETSTTLYEELVFRAIYYAETGTHAEDALCLGSDDGHSEIPIVCYAADRGLTIEAIQRNVPPWRALQIRTVTIDISTNKSSE